MLIIYLLMFLFNWLTWYSLVSVISPHSLVCLGVSIYDVGCWIAVSVNTMTRWDMILMAMIAMRLVGRMVLVMLLMPLVGIMMALMMLSTRSPFCVSLLYLWLFKLLFIFFPFTILLIDIWLVLVLSLMCLLSSSSTLCLRILSSLRIVNAFSFYVFTVHKLVVHPWILCIDELNVTELVVVPLDHAFAYLEQFEPIVVTNDLKVLYKPYQLATLSLTTHNFVIVTLNDGLLNFGHKSYLIVVAVYF